MWFFYTCYFHIWSIYYFIYFGYTCSGPNINFVNATSTKMQFDDLVKKTTQVATQGNTTQHEHDMRKHEYNMTQHEPTRVKDKVTSDNKSTTRDSTSKTRYNTSNARPNSSTKEVWKQKLVFYFYTYFYTFYYWKIYFLKFFWKWLI